MEKQPVSFATLTAVISAVASLPTINAEALASHLGVLAESESLTADEAHSIHLLADAVDTVHVTKLSAASRPPSAG